MSCDASICPFDKEQLAEIYDFALGLGRRAGQILLEGVEKRCGEESDTWQDQKEKESAVDIVTQADLGGLPSLILSRAKCGLILFVDVEAFVKDQINSKYPSHA